jgi:hypothetical protein
MNFKFVKTKDNSDATSNYDIIGDFPILISQFVYAMIDETNSFRATFYITNKQMGGWTKNKFELNKRDGEWHIDEEKPASLLDAIRDRKVVSCHANGGYGQMSYFCELEE